MLNKIFRILFTVSISCMWGCMAFHYPPVQKELYSRWIPNNQVKIIKGVILNEGYEKIGTQEDYHYEGAICTQYTKEITTDKIKSKVQIVMSFKDTDTPKGYYRNLGITILNLDRGDIPEINAEIDRIESILYKKLLEVAGKENVKRGKKEIYR